MFSTQSGIGKWQRMPSIPTCLSSSSIAWVFFIQYFRLLLCGVGRVRCGFSMDFQREITHAPPLLARGNHRMRLFRLECVQFPTQLLMGVSYVLGLMVDATRISITVLIVVSGYNVVLHNRTYGGTRLMQKRVSRRASLGRGFSHGYHQR